MIKEDLIRRLSEELVGKISYAQAKQYMDTMLICFEKVLLDKKKLMIRNFGSFVLRKKKERMGRNPKTKEEYKISKRYAITFYPAKHLKQSIAEDICIFLKKDL